MAKPSKRRWVVEKRQNGVLTRQRKQAKKVAYRLLGRRRTIGCRGEHDWLWSQPVGSWLCGKCNARP